MEREVRSRWIVVYRISLCAFSLLECCWMNDMSFSLVFTCCDVPRVLEAAKASHSLSHKLSIPLLSTRKDNLRWIDAMYDRLSARND